MPSPRDVPFISPSEVAAPGAGGFESQQQEVPAPATKPPPEAAPSPEQKARATDLFLRGALTPEELAKAHASRGGFEAIIGRPNFLPAVFLEIGAAVSRSTCLVTKRGQS